MQPDASAIVVLITTPSMEVARQIARHLLEQKLAACVNILPGVQSLYTWEEKIQEEEEILLIVKSRADLFEDGLLPAVQANHPYQVPEVIALPVVKGLDSYLNWIGDVTGG